MTHEAIRTCQVVMHAHSAWSYDAHWPLQRIARVMAWLGADAVMMTEHDTGFPADRFDEYRSACDAASTSQCRLIPGIEYSDPENAVHILTWGLDRFLGASRPVMQTLEDVAASGGAAVFAHPLRRNAWRLFDADWIPLLSAVEIWNRKTDGLAPCAEALQIVRRSGLPAAVGIDLHRTRQLWPLTNRVAIGPGDLECAVLSAFCKGLSRPEAFGRPLLDQSGELRTRWPDRLEAARRVSKRAMWRS